MAESELEPQPEKKPREMTFREFLKWEETGKPKRDLARMEPLVVDLLRQDGFSEEQICSMKMERIIEILRGVFVHDFDRLAACVPSNPELVTMVLGLATESLEDKP